MSLEAQEDAPAWRSVPRAPAQLGSSAPGAVPGRVPEPGGRGINDNNHNDNNTNDTTTTTTTTATATTATAANTTTTTTTTTTHDNNNDKEAARRRAQYPVESPKPEAEVTLDS